MLKLDPEWDALPAAIPASIRNLVQRCLTKDRKQRLQAIGEARIVLENPGGTEVFRPVEDVSRTKPLWPSVAAVFILAFAALAFVHFRKQPLPQPMMRFSVDLGPDAVAGPRITAAISPDGRLAFVERGGKSSSRAPPEPSRPHAARRHCGAVVPSFSRQPMDRVLRRR